MIVDYFGARYYDSDLSVWLSVDPMAKQRPSISPYNYCLYNPMNKVDPNGLIEVDPDKGASKIKGAIKPLVIKAKAGGYNDATSAALKFHKGQGDADFYDNKPKEPASTALPEAKPAEQKQTGSTGSTQSTPSLLTKIDASLIGSSSWGNAEGSYDGANAATQSNQEAAAATRIVIAGVLGGPVGIAFQVNAESKLYTQNGATVIGGYSDQLFNTQSGVSDKWIAAIGYLVTAKSYFKNSSMLIDNPSYRSGFEFSKSSLELMMSTDGMLNEFSKSSNEKKH